MGLLGKIGRGILNIGAGLGETALGIDIPGAGFKELGQQVFGGGGRRAPAPPPSLPSPGTRFGTPKLVKSGSSVASGNGRNGRIGSIPIPGTGKQFDIKPGQIFDPGGLPFGDVAPRSTMNGRNGSFEDDVTSLLGTNRIVVEPKQKVINKAPRGFVIVDMPDGSGKKAVLKSVARKLGLWRPRKKPPISASDWSKLKKVDRIKKKAKKIAETADFKCKKK